MTFRAVHSFFHDHAIGTGIVGTVSSFGASFVAWLQYGTVVLAFLSALFGVVGGYYTVILLRRKVRSLETK